MQEVLTIDETKELQVNKTKKAFLESITSDEEQMILADTLKRKSLLDVEKRKHRSEIKDLAKDMLNAPYVEFEDNSDLTFGEVLVAKTLADMMAKPNKSAKDLIELSKVTNGDTGDTNIKIVFETNGQELGD